MQKDTRLDRIVDKVVITDTCWLWPTKPNSKGYCYTLEDGRQLRAHRYVYEALVGPIPDGLVLDHLCFVTTCVNPDHLEPVTARENALRARHWPNAEKTHCAHGHPYDEANTFVWKRNGWRACKTCHRERRRAKP